MITAKYKGKYYDIEYSIVKFSELEGELRLDAEYYEPYYLKNDRKIIKKEWTYIGNLLSKVQYGISLAMNEDRVGYKILKMDDIRGILADNSNCKYVNIDPKTFLKFKLEKADVLFNRVNSEEFVGRTGIYLLDGEHTFASYLIRIRAKKYYTNFYITIYLNTKYGKLSLKRVMRRAVNQANINAKELKCLKVPIPSETFQKFIEKLVLKAYGERQKAEELYKQAEEALLEELGLKNWRSKTKKIKVGEKEFEEEENISIRMLSDVLKADRMDAEYWEPKYDELIGYLKSNFETKPLKTFLLDFQKGIEVGSHSYQEEGKTFIRVSNLSIHGFVEKDQKYIGEGLYQKLKDTYEPKVGDFLLTKDATPGIAYVVKEPKEGIIASGILKLKINEDEINKEYLALCINSTLGRLQIERDGGGSVITHWRPEQIKNLIIPILLSETQQKIASLVQQSYKARESSKKLLEIVKRAVEIYIEKDEAEGQKYINEQLQKMKGEDLGSEDFQ